MQESPQVREWQAKAWAEGWAEGRAEVRRETRAEDVRRAIRIRFGTPMPTDLKKQLAALQRDVDLDRWFEASQTASSLDAFRTAVQKA
jgi:hypothetical protein